MIESLSSASAPAFSFPLLDRWFAGLPAWAESLAGLAILIALAALANFIFKSILLRMALRVLPHDTPALGRAVARLTNIVPAMVVSRGITAVPHLPPSLVTLVQNVAGAFVILTIVLALSHALTFVNDLYQRRPHAVNRPIKGYIQVLKIVLFAAAAILMIAQLMDKSPLLLLSGLGAMAAVIMLVFKDTILSLVASVQLTSNDMLRVGDWIEMPQLNADGDVIDIALHTVKVQNWDKTITTIPTHRLIEESFKNWRGMSESGGRRIKRSLMIDQTSVRFLSDQEERSLRRFALLGDYLAEKQAELERWNSRIADDGLDPVNSRRVTNFGTFRAYVAAYLRANARISKEMTLLVRQLDPTPQGIPLEIYCFTTTTAWADYEAIQADIFDHMLAVLESFDLRVFQEPSGRDLRQLKAA